MMRILILFICLSALVGCKVSQKNDDQNISEVDLNDGRTYMLMEFNKITKYPELTDDDVKNGEINLMFYKADDFVTTMIYGITDEKKIDSIIEEIKTVLKNREISQYLVVEIYPNAKRTSKTTIAMGDLAKRMEIKKF